MDEKTNFAWPEGVSESVMQLLDSVTARPETMSHAFLFVGNNAAAAKVIQALARRITDQEFPNIDTAEFDAGTCNLEDMREVLRLASLKPLAAPKKIVVLWALEQASTQILNAILKTLEEPPASAIFMLHSTRPLLATVMSRCQVINVVGESQEIGSDTVQALADLESIRQSGLAERLAYVNTLADMDNDALQELLRLWLGKQKLELKDNPQSFPFVRTTMETIQALEHSFNKKMVLQNFVTKGLS
jgi:DNA polymerase III delta prime subunit